MKHLKPFALTVLTMAVCLVFTGCPNKPDERIIPDGIYKETVNIKYAFLLERPTRTDTSLFLDRQAETFVTIRNGIFEYEDMCSKPYWNEVVDSNDVVVDTATFYRSTFIYYASYYCPDAYYYGGIVPARIVNFDKVKIEKPAYTFRIDSRVSFYDTITFYAPLVRTNDGYQFDIRHRYQWDKTTPAMFHLHHTLVYDRPLQ